MSNKSTTATSTGPSETAIAPLPVTDMERYLFDLRGYLVLRGAIAKDHVTALNDVLDEITQLDPPLAHGEWYGGVHAHTFGGQDGVNLQQIYEAGGPFERLIDHPNWIEKVKTFVGGQDDFDSHHGSLFIDENFASIRRKGEAIGLHSGGHKITKRTQFRCENGRFACGQINILMALTDIGPGDGATMVIPGSHKANFEHPQTAQARMDQDEVRSVDDVEGAIEVHMQAGDVLLFVDAISHGSAKRQNEQGQRRICVYRYGASWGMFRHPYRPTQALLDRLPDQRRKIVWPHTPIKREPNRIAGTPNPPDAQA